MTVKVDAKKLIEVGAHYGHQTKRWNPKMEAYLYGSEKGVHVFDLIKTRTLLEEALSEITEASKRGQSIVFVGTKKQIKDLVAETATAAGCYFVNQRWLGGILTNFEQIKKSLKLLDEMKGQKAEGEYDSYTKRERRLIDLKIEKMDRFFGGLKGLVEKPDLLIIIDVKKERGAAIEAKKMGVTTVGIVDSNSDPDLVDFVIPMNDDATKAITYVLGLFKEAVLEGRKSKSRSKRGNKKDRPGTVSKASEKGKGGG